MPMEPIVIKINNIPEGVSIVLIIGYFQKFGEMGVYGPETPGNIERVIYEHPVSFEINIIDDLGGTDKYYEFLTKGVLGVEKEALKTVRLCCYDHTTFHNVVRAGKYVGMSEIVKYLKENEKAIIRKMECRTTLQEDFEQNQGRRDPDKTILANFERNRSIGGRPQKSDFQDFGRIYRSLVVKRKRVDGDWTLKDIYTHFSRFGEIENFSTKKVKKCKNDQFINNRQPPMLEKSSGNQDLELQTTITFVEKDSIKNFVKNTDFKNLTLNVELCFGRVFNAQEPSPGAQMGSQRASDVDEVGFGAEQKPGSQSSEDEEEQLNEAQGWPKSVGDEAQISEISDSWVSNHEDDCGGSRESLEVLQLQQPQQEVSESSSLSNPEEIYRNSEEGDSEEIETLENSEAIEEQRTTQNSPNLPIYNASDHNRDQEISQTTQTQPEDFTRALEHQNSPQSLEPAPRYTEPEVIPAYPFNDENFSIDEDYDPNASFSTLNSVEEFFIRERRRALLNPSPQNGYSLPQQGYMVQNGRIVPRPARLAIPLIRDYEPIESETLFIPEFIEESRNPRTRNRASERTRRQRTGNGVNSESDGWRELSRSRRYYPEGRDAEQPDQETLEYYYGEYGDYHNDLDEDGQEEEEEEAEEEEDQQDNQLDEENRQPAPLTGLMDYTGTGETNQVQREVLAGRVVEHTPAPPLPVMSGAEEGSEGVEESEMVSECSDGLELINFKSDPDEKFKARLIVRAKTNMTQTPENFRFISLTKEEKLARMRRKYGCSFEDFKDPNSRETCFRGLGDEFEPKNGSFGQQGLFEVEERFSSEFHQTSEETHLRARMEQDYEHFDTNMGNPSGRASAIPNEYGRGGLGNFTNFDRNSGGWSRGRGGNQRLAFERNFGNNRWESGDEYRQSRGNWDALGQHRRTRLY